MTGASEDVGMMRAGNETRKGDWMETFSGVKFFPLDPRADEVLLADVAHHLSRIHRYGGAIKLEHYSVAEHSVVMAEWIERTYPKLPMVALQALLHDGPEAYIGDMVRPVKRQPEMAAFGVIEGGIWHVLAAKFGVPVEMHFLVKEADNRILVDERRQVMNPSSNAWGIDHLAPLNVCLSGWSPWLAKERFLSTYQRLSDKRGQ